MIMINNYIFKYIYIYILIKNYNNQLFLNKKKKKKKKKHIFFINFKINSTYNTCSMKFYNVIVKKNYLDLNE